MKRNTMDAIEMFLTPMGYKLQRDYCVGMFAVDGYIPELEIIIELEDYKPEITANRRQEILQSCDNECSIVYLDKHKKDAYNLGYLAGAIAEVLASRDVLASRKDTTHG